MSANPDSDVPLGSVRFHEREEESAGADSPAGSTRNYAILDEFLRDCCLELMADYGLPAKLQVEINASQPPSAVTMAATDFSGRDLRGTIALRMTRSVVLETYRTALGSVCQAGTSDESDWTCELVNQLIGRLKNKLRAYRVSFDVNSPRLLRSFPAADVERALRRRFVCDGGKFAGYLDVMIAPGVVFMPSAPEAPLAAEGDLVLF